MLKGIRVFAIALFAILLLPVISHAQSGRTFYIDYASGSNSNAGTKASPWKTAYYMQHGGSCDSGAPSYTHTSGDHFIFKGGVTWPAACLALIITQGGSSASTVTSAGTVLTINGADYYGVDQTWFTGGSFTRPVFDAQNTTPTGVLGAFVKVTANNVTLDDLEMKNALQPAIGFAQCQRGSIDLETTSGVVMDHLFIHDWSIGSLVNQEGSWHAQASICSNISGAYNDSVYNTEMSDAGQPAGSQFGTCFVGLGEVAYNNCHNVGEGAVFTHGQFHDNQVVNLDGTTATSPSGAHSNAYESDTAGAPSAFYNNYFYNDDVGFNDVCVGTSIYNNVISKVINSGAGSINGEISLDTNCGASSGTQTFFYNNTVDTTQPGGSGSCATIVVRGGGQSGLVTLDNNICIGVGFDLSGATVTPSQATNTVMNTTDANTYGFTPTRKYAPTSSDPAVVGAGTDLTSQYTGLLAAAAYDAEGAPWYATTPVARTTTPTLGAFQWPLSGVGNPVDSFVPTSLTFSTQTTGTSSSPQTTTLTNTGSATDAISGISITGANASQFTQTNNCSSALTAGSSCQINVTFSPTTAGSQIANVSITDTVNPGGAAVVSLSGTGQAPGLFSHVSSSIAPGKFTNSTTCSVTLASTPASGSTTKFEVYAFNSSLVAAGSATVQDGASHSFTATSSSPVGTGTSGQISIFHLLNTPGGASPTITATFGASVSQLACWAQNSQVASGYTVSLDADAGGTGTTGTSVNTPSLTPSTAQEDIVAVGVPLTSGISAVNAPMTGTDNIYEPTAGAPFGAADAWVENQTSAINPNMMIAASDGWVSMVAAYKATATGSVPTISSLSITSGNEGASVTITGTNFGASQGASTVQINSTAMTCSSWSATSLGCTIPSPSSTGGISVTTTDGTSNSVTFTVTPHLSSLSVTSGAVGTSTVLTGTGFGATQGSSTVAFNGTTATATAWSDTSITTTAPAAATTGNVIVTQGGNASNGISFTVNPHIASLSPTHAVVGAAVAISGTTFGATQGASTVKFNGATATCSSWADLLLSCTVPSTTTGNVVVHNGTDSNGVSFTVDAPVSTPVIASVTPSAGPANTILTITGSNFGSTQSTSTLTFNGVSAAVTSWSATQIVCVAPTISIPGASTLNGNMVVTVTGNASNTTPFTMYLYSFVTIGTTK